MKHTRLLPLLLLIFTACANVAASPPTSDAQTTTARARYHHAADAIGNTSMTFGWLEGQQYLQATSAAGHAIFPLSPESGERITKVEAFLENTVATAQTVVLRRKSMTSTLSVLVSVGVSPATTGNHTLSLDVAEDIIGDNQWYVRVFPGDSNRVRGLRVTYEPSP